MSFSIANLFISVIILLSRRHRVNEMTFLVHSETEPTLTYTAFKEFVAQKAAESRAIANCTGGVASWKDCAIGQYLTTNRKDYRWGIDGETRHIDVATAMMQIDMPHHLFDLLDNCRFNTYRQLHDVIEMLYSEAVPWTRDELLEETTF